MQHPFFTSYEKNINYKSQEKEIDFERVFKDVNIASRDKIAKGENFDVFESLEGYAGNISTSQLKNIDYSKFENHTFFDSAVHKVSYAFNEIINFPYDAYEIEYYKYISSLDGYTKYLLDNVYPKNVSACLFDGSNKIVIEDKKGSILKDYSGEVDKRDNTLSTIKKENNFTFTIEFSKDSIQSNKEYVVFQNYSTTSGANIDEGYYCIVGSNDSGLYVKYCVKYNNIEYFSIASLEDESDSTNVIKANISINIKKITQYTGLEASFIINGNIRKLEDNNKVITNPILFETFSDEFFYPNETRYLILGSCEGVLGLNNFVGAIDEFIVFSKLREELDVKISINENIFPDVYTLLYLKFNEPEGDYVNSLLSLDSSGNKLHGLMFVGNQPVTNTTSYKVNSLLSNEDINLSPVVIGSYPDITDTRNNLIELARSYDIGNSNIIYKLLPAHYFTNAANFENTADYIENNPTIYSQATNSVSEDSNISIMTKLSLVFARFFDQLKLYVDALSDMSNLDYESINRKEFINAQMETLCKLYGFTFKEINYNKSKKILSGKNITYNDIVSEIDLATLQNLIWKKILINSQQILRTKGTYNGINSVINAVGYDLKRFVNIEEKSYQNFVDNTENYRNDFIKSNGLCFYKFIEQDKSPYFLIQNLGYYDHSADMVKTHFDSNEFSVETFFSFNKTILKSKENKNSITTNNKQSIFRLIANLEYNVTVLSFINVYAKFSNPTSRFFDLVFEYKKSIETSEFATLTIENINAYDIDHFVAITLKRDNLTNKITAAIYHNSVGDIIESNKILVKEITIDNASNDSFLFDNVDLNNKISYDIATGTYFNNNEVISQSVIKSVEDVYFEGTLYCSRVWKKALSKSECLLHSKNIDNLSEKRINFNIKQSNLCCNYDFDKIKFIESDGIIPNHGKVLQSEISDKLSLVNQEDLNIAKIFTTSKSNNRSLIEGIQHKDLLKYMFNSFQLSTQLFSNKLEKSEKNNLNSVNILSYSSEENKIAYNNDNVYPANKIPFDYNPIKTDFLSVEMSVTKKLDDVITNLIFNLDQITKAISTSNIIYDYDYKVLNDMRQDFFNNVNEEIDFNGVNYVFKYFDNIMNNILLEMTPQNVNFRGFNLVYESHALERAKYQYKNKNSTIPIVDYNKYTTKYDTVSSQKRFVRDVVYNNNRKHNS